MRSWPFGPAPSWALWVTVVAGVVLATPATVLADDVVVEIHGYEYHAPAITVPAGASVTWTNSDSARHDVASTAGPVAFASPELAEGESFSYTFTVPGDYAYLCTLHPDMIGTLAVTAAPTTTVPAVEVAPAGGVAPDLTASTTTVTTTVAAAELAAPVAAVDDPDLGDASRPYVEYLAIVAAVVVAVGLLFGSQRRRRAPT